MIIVVASEKGGTGKTTIATNLAIIRAKNASDVLLVDTDPQRSAMDFVTVREEEGHTPEITCTAIMGRGIGAELRKLEPKFDDIIVDVGGRDTATLRGSMLSADVLVVPFNPSQYDTWGVERMDILLDEVILSNDKLRTVAFINRDDTNPKMLLASEASKLASEFRNLDFKSFSVGDRVAYRRSVADGLSVTELKSKSKSDLKAIEEMSILYQEVFKNA